MNLKLMINIKDVDKNGKVFGEREFEANSLVKGFITFLACQLGLSAQTYESISGYTRSTSGGDYNLNVGYGNYGEKLGIVVGTGTNAVAIDDIALQIPIINGSGAGELQYSNMEQVSNFQVSGSNCYYEIRRAFTNNSGSDITINEIGIYVGMYTAPITDNYRMCIDRTLQTTTVTNGNGKVITYKFQVSV